MLPILQRATFHSLLRSLYSPSSSSKPPACPSHPATGKVLLITGINGYIASVLAKLVLSKGYSVRGTTRRAASARGLVDRSLALYTDRIEIWEVPDITVEGAFDKTVKGIHGIFHAASPLNLDLATWESVVVPAVRGTEVLLNSALAHAGDQLEAVIVTSSGFALINNDAPAGYVMTEPDSNTWAVEAAKSLKAHQLSPRERGGIFYSASKAAANLAVWKFREEHKPTFAISTIHPALVIGAPVVLPASPDKLNETLKLQYQVYNSTDGELPKTVAFGCVVDVEDVAILHLWSYEHPFISDGEKYLACSGVGPYQAAADILREHYPHRKQIPLGHPGEGYVAVRDSRGKIVHVQPEPGSVCNILHKVFSKSASL